MTPKFKESDRVRLKASSELVDWDVTDGIFPSQRATVLEYEEDGEVYAVEVDVKDREEGDDDGLRECDEGQMEPLIKLTGNFYDEEER
jgi:hypothetical protein